MTSTKLQCHVYKELKYIVKMQKKMQKENPGGGGGGTGRGEHV